MKIAPSDLFMAGAGLVVVLFFIGLYLDGQFDSEEDYEIDYGRVILLSLGFTVMWIFLRKLIDHRWILVKKNSTLENYT